MANNNAILWIVVLSFVCFAATNAKQKPKPVTFMHNADNKANNVVNKAMKYLDSRLHFKTGPVKTSTEAHNGNTFKRTSTEAHNGNTFDWHDCCSGDGCAHVKSLTVSPDPIPIPGNVTVSFSGTLPKTLSAPVELSLTIEKHEGFWIEVPCLDDLGSCDYPDVCPMLDLFTCPPAFEKHGIPCKCPIKAGTYSLPKSMVDVEPFGIPSWLENGRYKVTANLKSSGQSVFCIYVQFALEPSKTLFN